MGVVVLLLQQQYGSEKMSSAWCHTAGKEKKKFNQKRLCKISKVFRST